MHLNYEEQAEYLLKLMVTVSVKNVAVVGDLGKLGL